MGRQEKPRSVFAPPRFFRFHSEQAPMASGESRTETASIDIKLDEYEALRLSDKLGLDHTEASSIMGISRPTFTKLLNRSRHKMASFLTDGGNLEITGGKVLFAANVFCCRSCHRPFKWEKERSPECPRCGGTAVLKAQPSCDHDCRCCETAASL